MPKQLFRPNATAIARIRVLAGLSQRALARKVGCHPSLIGQIEAGIGACSESMLLSIAAALGVPIESVSLWSPADPEEVA